MGGRRVGQRACAWAPAVTRRARGSATCAWRRAVARRPRRGRRAHALRLQPGRRIRLHGDARAHGAVHAAQRDAVRTVVHEQQAQQQRERRAAQQRVPRAREPARTRRGGARRHRARACAPLPLLPPLPNPSAFPPTNPPTHPRVVHTGGTLWLHSTPHRPRFPDERARAFLRLFRSPPRKRPPKRCDTAWNRGKRRLRNRGPRSCRPRAPRAG